jgi:hypothetical protein
MTGFNNVLKIFCLRTFNNVSYGTFKNGALRRPHMSQKRLNSLRLRGNSRLFLQARTVIMFKVVRTVKKIKSAWIQVRILK